MPRPSQPMPDDFAMYAECEGNLRLRKRYNVGGVTIERWRRQLGVRYTPPAMPKRASRPVVVRKARKRYQATERIEDLTDGFDLGRCVRSGGYGYV